MKKVILIVTILILIVFGIFFRQKINSVFRSFADYYSESTVGNRIALFLDQGREAANNVREEIGALPERLSETSLDEEKKVRGTIVSQIGIISDSHGYSSNIESAVNRIKEADAELIIHLGDFTAGGEDHYFSQAKDILEASSLPYHVLPGDHDFNWFPQRSRTNYERHFGQSYDRAVVHEDLLILLYDNSTDPTNWIEKRDWLSHQLSANSDKSVLFFSAKPLFNPYFPTKIDANGEEIISLLNESGVRYAFAGDTHIFARYLDQKDRINMVTVGAVGEYKNPLPQWVLVSITDLGEVIVDPRPLVKL